MKKRILDILCCPSCKQDLALIENEVADGEIVEGIVECNKCQRSYPIIKSVPRMILDLGDRKDLADSWGYQWKVVSQGKLESDTYYGETKEEEIVSFFNYLGIGKSDLAGKVILDAGCGCGRLTKDLGEFGSEIIGIDIANSIESIHKTCETVDNVHIIQADIVNLPFKDASFDYVFSKLAVCYVHEPEQAFKSLSSLVKSSGRLFISVPDKESLSFVVKLKDLLRITHKIPRSLLLYLSWCFAPLLALVKWVSGNPMTSIRTNAFFLFNALHPSFMTRHTFDEVKSWFEGGNFDHITKIHGMSHLIHVRGTQKED